LGSKRIVRELRGFGIKVKIHNDYFAKDAQDVDWLPEVGKIRMGNPDKRCQNW
jgi:hypothetical protein